MEESKGKGMDQLSLPQEGEGMEAVPVNLFPVAEGPIATKIREVVQNSSLLPSNIEILNISNYVRTLRALGMRRMNARVVEKTKLSDKFTAKIWKMKFDPSERQFVPVLSTVGRKYKTKAQARDAAIKAAQERDAEPEFYVDENGKYASDAEIKEFLARQGVESPRSMASSMTGTTMKSAATRRTVGSVRTKFTQATSKTKSRAKKTLDNTPRWKRCEETYLKIIVVSEKFKGYAFPYQFSMLHSVICQVCSCVFDIGLAALSALTLAPGRCCVDPSSAGRSVPSVEEILGKFVFPLATVEYGFTSCRICRLLAIMFKGCHNF